MRELGGRAHALERGEGAFFGRALKAGFRSRRVIVREIDFAEMYSLYPDRAIPFIHYNPATPDPNQTNNYCFIPNLDQFHTYDLEWTQSSIKVIYDGQTCLDDDWNPAAPHHHPQPFDQPFVLNLTQAFGSLNNLFIPGMTPLPATTDVDYVHVWKYSDQSGEEDVSAGGPTGRRALALKKCNKVIRKKRRTKKQMKKAEKKAKRARKKCKKKALRLPV